ncbi:MAG: PAS domain-containing sensor histidine kinase [Ponticaulis sp.]|nr:PAS domain-containing sensor histidine kinase [Ponticaulis sp.]
MLASLIAVIVTLVSFSGMGPIRPASSAMLWLLAINFIMIGILAYYVGRDFFALSNRSDDHHAPMKRGSLGRRFAGLFSFAVVAPAILVTLFLGTSLNRSIESWFSERIENIVEGSADIARSNLQAIADDLRLDVGIMAIDLNAAAVGYETEPDVFSRFLYEQATYREFTGAFLVDDMGNILVATDQASRRSFVEPPPEMYDDANNGDVSVSLDNERSEFRALFKLEGYENAYIYTARPIDPQLLNSLMRSEQTMSDYRAAEEASRKLQVIFILGFIQITALILLFFIRFGLHAASQISWPISNLANAADDVRKGKLDTRVPMPRHQNEVSELTAAFNAMTAQLSQQRDTIDAAHKEALARSQFIEAVLEGVSAGVVRVDERMKVVLLNPSAYQMFPVLGERAGSLSLTSSLPQFAELAEQAIEEQNKKEKTLVLEQNGVERFLLVRAVPILEDDPGCVLTFDDTTRLITAQRQTAWRDVARRIAHEIRNPLTPIQLSTERIRKRYRHLIDEEDAVFDRCTDTIFRQVADIGRMVEEFSSFARMPKPDVRAFDFVDAVKNAVFGSRLSLPDIEIELSKDQESIVIWGDERLIGQCLTNLIKNAGEAVQRRGETDDSDWKRQIEVKVRTKNDHVLLEIEDTGPGFPEDNRNQFLEPYFTTREQGVGLGLAIVNRIVQDHGGHLTLLNREDGEIGARVALRLPVSGPSEEVVSSWSLSEERV